MADTLSQMHPGRSSTEEKRGPLLVPSSKRRTTWESLGILLLGSRVIGSSSPSFTEAPCALWRLLASVLGVDVDGQGSFPQGQFSKHTADKELVEPDADTSARCEP